MLIAPGVGSDMGSWKRCHREHPPLAPVGEHVSAYALISDQALGIQGKNALFYSMSLWEIVD